MTNNVEELIVLGNGFDLQCGLKTSYWDFFSYTLRNLDGFKQYKDDEKKDPIEYFENTIIDCLEYKYLEFEEILVSKTNFERIPKNIWYQIFLYEKKRNAEWYQIENIILDYVQNKEYISKIVFVLMELKNKGQSSHVIKRLVKNFEYNFVVLISYVLSKNDAGIALLLSKEETTTIEIQKYVATALIKNLKEVEDNFMDFLQEELQNKEYIDKSNTLLVEKICKNISLLIEDGNVLSCNILTFNYTCPFNDMYFKVVNYFNVHGKVVLNGKNNEIIFGIDHKLNDEKTIPTNSLAYRFTKNYRTLQLYSTNSEYENYPNVYDKNIKKIKFYGHSLAEADYAYFQQMFDYYDLYSNNDLQLIFYYSVYSKKTEEEIKQEQFSSISKLISTYGKTLDNKDKGNNLLTRLMQTGRLRLVQI